MNNLFKFVLISTLSVGGFGCSASPERDAADARVAAADARVDAADARVAAADAYIKAAAAYVTAADAHPKAGASPWAKASVRDGSSKVVIPLGTVLKVSLIDSLNSDTSAAGERFRASLAEPVVINGATLLPKGTKVQGRVIGVEDSGRVRGQASIRLALSDIAQGNRMVAITTEIFTATVESSTTSDSEIITRGAKRAGVGGATSGGAGVVLATKGKEIRYYPHTRLNFTLTNPVGM